MVNFRKKAEPVRRQCDLYVLYLLWSLVWVRIWIYSRYVPTNRTTHCNQWRTTTRGRCDDDAVSIEALAGLLLLFYPLCLVTVLCNDSCILYIVIIKNKPEETHHEPTSLVGSNPPRIRLPSWQRLLISYGMIHCNPIERLCHHTFHYTNDSLSRSTRSNGDRDGRDAEWWFQRAAPLPEESICQDDTFKLFVVILQEDTTWKRKVTLYNMNSS